MELVSPSKLHLRERERKKRVRESEGEEMLVARKKERKSCLVV